MFCNKKRGHFQTEEQGWVPFFAVSEGAGYTSRHIMARTNTTITKAEAMYQSNPTLD